MRWLGFAIVAGITVILQVTLAERCAVAGTRPDWILVVVVCYALHGRGPDAVLAGWALGLLADMHTLERFGMLSLLYGLVAAGVYLVREIMFPRHPLAQFTVTLFSGLLVQFAALLYRQWLYGLPRGWSGEWALIVLTAVYTAFWAPPLQALLLRLGPLLGLNLPRRGQWVGARR